MRWEIISNPDALVEWVVKDGVVFLSIPMATNRNVTEFGTRPDLSGFPFEGHIDMGEEEIEPACECVLVNEDYVDASGCPFHGPHSRLAREQREREADDQAEYYRAAGGADVTF